jgi:molybdopterin converting factor small subunit
MTPYQIQLFGITRDIIGQTVLDFPLAENTQVDTLLANLKANYPQLNNIKSLLVAVNSEYAEAGQVINPSDEIALIPPVSGG